MAAKIYKIDLQDRLTKLTNDAQKEPAFVEFSSYAQWSIGHLRDVVYTALLSSYDYSDKEVLSYVSYRLMVNVTIRKLIEKKSGYLLKNYGLSIDTGNPGTYYSIDVVYSGTVGDKPDSFVFRLDVKETNKVTHVIKRFITENGLVFIHPVQPNSSKLKDSFLIGWGVFKWPMEFVVRGGRADGEVGDCSLRDFTPEWLARLISRHLESPGGIKDE